jgi:hypothetical protein
MRQRQQHNDHNNDTNNHKKLEQNYFGIGGTVGDNKEPLVTLSNILSIKTIN